ncbi:hypothetical protein COCVIDRAFT_32828 [Bipolaris victoriae FI3]|uniref:Uncharacterized protein n=1 Tax=Bipolaris victoriae (strain FI3) TaxID=930091 RepID=W7EXF9_BIPV3|nr:hypothetical protein COCVIDRAFT_32828 [Bipolaris victoriae FI3]
MAWCDQPSDFADTCRRQRASALVHGGSMVRNETREACCVGALREALATTDVAAQARGITRRDKVASLCTGKCKSHRVAGALTRDAALTVHGGQQAGRRRKQKDQQSSRPNPPGRPGTAAMYTYRRGLLCEAFGGVARTLFCGYGVHQCKGRLHLDCMTACHGDNLARGRGGVHSRGCWSRCWSLVTTAADRAEASRGVVVVVGGFSRFHADKRGQDSHCSPMIWERAQVRCWGAVLGRWGAGVPSSVLQLEHPPIAFSTRILAVANRHDSLPPRFISDRICFSPLHLVLVLVSAHPMPVPATIDRTRHCDQ